MELQSKLIQLAQSMGPRIYPFSMSVGAGETKIQSIRTDSKGSFLLEGITSQFDFIADLPTINIRITDTSNGAYVITGGFIPLSTISNIGKKGNQALHSYFDLESVFEKASTIEIALQNTGGSSVNVDLGLVGKQFKFDV